MGLASHKHNARIGKPPVVISSSLARERESGTATLTGTDRQGASAEIKINLDIYPVYERWLAEQIAEFDEITVEEAIHAGARHMRQQTGHGSPQSARNYLSMNTVGQVAPPHIVVGGLRKGRAGNP